jgi:hypothetical protein
VANAGHKGETSTQAKAWWEERVDWSLGAFALNYRQIASTPLLKERTK